MIQSFTPRIEINLAKIAHNANVLLQLFDKKGIGIMGVTKAVCGDPAVAKVFVEAGIHTLADSKISNIKKMRDAKVEAEYVLLKISSIQEVGDVTRYADVSIQSEWVVIEKLSQSAKRANQRHKIILMIEMGDGREGILPKDIHEMVQKILGLSGVQLVGIAANFACFGGVKPSNEKLSVLSLLASELESTYSLCFDYISGGNSANYQWFTKVEDPGNINNVRLGESILLGVETLEQKTIPALYTNTFTFVSEVVEAKEKPSLPDGEIGKDAFGNIPSFKDKGMMNRVILGVGHQDILIRGLTPLMDVEILGASSDHMVIDAKTSGLRVGDEVDFSCTYGALLQAMTSPYVTKKYVCH
ncbi:alanine/ornithine racemase family PLP-dependent enzyme [Salibacterium salarium]|uniref:alanine/ornithine racemase family PLP-dependent enzyme n=1 Tax=Salibacterium salarium TaxID=284579 RepID=UPI0027D87028|nr:alanine/ornithine racemase family PLP-dependent enzyme [Salibacterium salarium]